MGLMMALEALTGSAKHNSCGAREGRARFSSIQGVSPALRKHATSTGHTHGISSCMPALPWRHRLDGAAEGGVVLCRLSEQALEDGVAHCGKCIRQHVAGAPCS